MTQRVNPYESPQGIEVIRRQPTESIVLGRLRGPTVGLIVLAGSQVIGMVIWLPEFFIRLATRDPDFAEFGWMILAALPSFFILYASVRMRQLRSL